MSGEDSATLHVVAVEEGTSDVVAALGLRHGGDPAQELRRRGWTPVALADVTGTLGSAGGLTLHYVVRGSGAGQEPLLVEAVPTDPDLVRAEGEEPHVHQRAAAYGVVRSDRGLLLTSLSATTNAPGLWTLPGGGLDPGETVVDGLRREVWEESGQHLTRPRLLEVQTSHWVGRAPSGRLEDFHAVRVVFAAECPEPTDPVVHDVGGSTDEVRWVPLEDLGRYDLSRSFAPHLQRWLDAEV